MRHRDAEHHLLTDEILAVPRQDAADIVPGLGWAGTEAAGPVFLVGLADARYLAPSEDLLDLPLLDVVPLAAGRVGQSAVGAAEHRGAVPSALVKRALEPHLEPHSPETPQRASEMGEAQQADALLGPVSRAWGSMPRLAEPSVRPAAPVERPLASEEPHSVLPAGALQAPLLPEPFPPAAQLARRTAPLVSARAFSAQASPPRQRPPHRRPHGSVCVLIPHAADRSSSSASSSL